MNSHPLKGRKLTEEHKRRISNTHKQLYVENDNHTFKKDMSGENNPFHGKNHTNELRKKISKSLKKRFKDKENTPWYGKQRSNADKKKISHTLRGRGKGIPKSEETKRKISRAKKEKPLSKEHRIALSNSHLGYKIPAETKKKMRLSALNYIENLDGQIAPKYNVRACEFFDQLNKKLGLDGHHAQNGGEYHIKELGYFVDYYEPNLNLVIEWDESNHYDLNGDLKEKDLSRQVEIEQLLDCIFLRIQQDGELNKQLNLISAYIEILHNQI